MPATIRISKTCSMYAKPVDFGYFRLKLGLNKPKKGKLL